MALVLRWRDVYCRGGGGGGLKNRGGGAPALHLVSRNEGVPPSVQGHVLTVFTEVLV